MGKAAAKKLTVAQYIEQQLLFCGRSQREVAEMMGYTNPNIVTMFKSGKTKVPLNKTAQLAKALNVDPVFFTRLVLDEYAPDLSEVFTMLLGRAAMVSDNELALLALAREATQGSEFNLDDDKVRDELSAAFQEVATRNQKRVDAFVEAANKIPKQLRAAQLAAGTTS